MKISVAKSVAIITPAFDFKDVEFLDSVEPRALELRDGDDNVLFAVRIGEPSISNFGVTVSEKRDIILQFDKPVTREMVLAKYPKAFLRMQTLEQQITQAAAQLREQAGEVEFETLA